MDECEHRQIEFSEASVTVGRTIYEHKRLECEVCAERVVLIQEQQSRRIR